MKKVMTKKASVKKVAAYKKGGVKKMENGGKKKDDDVIRKSDVKKFVRAIDPGNIAAKGAKQYVKATASAARGAGKTAMKMTGADKIVKMGAKASQAEGLSKLTKKQAEVIAKQKAALKAKGSSGDDKMTGLQFNPYKGTSGKSSPKKKSSSYIADNLGSDKLRTSGTKKKTTAPVKKTGVGAKPAPVKANVPTATKVMRDMASQKGTISMTPQNTGSAKASSTPVASGNTVKDLKAQIKTARKEKGVLSGVKAKVQEKRVARLEKKLARIKGTEMKKGGMKKTAKKK